MQDLYRFADELGHELKSILNYWATQTPDAQNGGFIGQIDFDNTKQYASEKGSVMLARILWTFSAAFKYDPQQEYSKTARRAFEYLSENFLDKEYGGIYWTLNYKGEPENTKKQIYALAFAIYGFSEFHSAFGDQHALAHAKMLYEQIEQHAFDAENNGYFEAFTRDWQPVSDLRLSEKDANEKKTMNTHLHIVEAYANLYRIWPDADLQKRIENLLTLIDDKFIRHETGNLRLFFDENWNEKPDVISFGHDIEAAWLLLDCAEVTENPDLISKFRKNAILLADATKKGIDDDGGLWYEFDPEPNQLIAEKHWWPQAELLLGYFCAWEISNDPENLEIVFKNWEFIKQHIIDRENGEWFWGINAYYSKIEKDKAGLWKCCYHNGRACLELINRIYKTK